MRKGQMSLEYAMLIACIVAGLIVMQAYIRRSISGRLKESSDQIGEQYEPGATSGSITITVNRDTSAEIVSNITGEGADRMLQTTTTVTINEESETRSGEEFVGPIE